MIVYFQFQLSYVVNIQKNVLQRHLSISSVRNKFKSANELTRNNFDIFIITESRLDSSLLFIKTATKIKVVLHVT